MDFAALKTEVATLLIDAPTAITTLTPSFVNRALRKLQQKHNFKVMESEVAFTTTALTRLLGPRPTDWKEPRGKPYYVSETGKLHEFVYAPSKADAIAAFGDNPDFDFGSPRAIWEVDLSGEFDIYPYPDALSDYADGEYRVTLPYWKYLGNLIADSDTNWFTSNAEQWIIYKSVAEGFYANEDEGRAQLWDRRADREYADVLLADKRRRIANVEAFVPHLGARRPHLEE